MPRGSTPKRKGTPRRPTAVSAIRDKENVLNATLPAADGNSTVPIKEYVCFLRYDLLLFQILNRALWRSVPILPISFVSLFSAKARRKSRVSFTPDVVAEVRYYKKGNRSSNIGLSDPTKSPSKGGLKRSLVVDEQVPQQPEMAKKRRVSWDPQVDAVRSFCFFLLALFP